MAIDMQERFATLAQGWQKRGYEIAMGIGVAHGYATIGAIGFEGRRDYGAIGTVPNLAARLCGEAGGGQILISQRVCGRIEAGIETEHVGELFPEKTEADCGPDTPRGKAPDVEVVAVAHLARDILRAGVL